MYYKTPRGMRSFTVLIHDYTSFPGRKLFGTSGNGPGMALFPHPKVR